MNLTDYFVQKKIQGGDIREYERLFKKYYGPLCQSACKILRDMDMAEDIVQEFFYQFWKNRESFTLRVSLNAYLFQSVRNNSLHYLEHLEVRRQYASMLLDETGSGQQVMQQDGPEIGEINQLVDSTLEGLPERCSTIFRMNRFEGKKYREIAEILSISVKTVEADMGKALQVFRETLKEYHQPGS
jgi:RNA polymerase sigma-70 factor, ECF subfamily